MHRRWFSSPPTAWIFASYLALAVLQAWPLPLHLRTHVTGPPGGDTGVYVWNTWAFRHELLERHSSPFTTKSVFALDREADLSLHNYTVFADVAALPLQPLLGVVGAFNVVYLVNVALAGFGMYLLAHRFTCRRAESWVAGLLFAWSPFLAARATAHFSLVAAAPLPIFVYWLDRAWTSMRTRDAIAAGLTAAWAAFCDPYYLVYCAMLERGLRRCARSRAGAAADAAAHASACAHHSRYGVRHPGHPGDRRPRHRRRHAQDRVAADLDADALHAGAAAVAPRARAAAAGRAAAVRAAAAAAAAADAAARRRGGDLRRRSARACALRRRPAHGRRTHGGGAGAVAIERARARSAGVSTAQSQPPTDARRRSRRRSRRVPAASSSRSDRCRSSAWA